MAFKKHAINRVFVVTNLVSWSKINPSDQKNLSMGKWEWGSAAGWGLIFTTGLTIIGLHFQQISRQSYWNGVANCRDFGGKKILASGI